MGDSFTQHGSSLRDYLQIARRRKWIILAAALLVPATAVYLSTRQTKVYEASAQVYLNQQDLSSALTGVPGSTTFQSPDRVAQTQADIARVPDVAVSTIEALNLHTRTPGDLLGSSTVTPKPDSNILVFTVRDTSPRLAARMATEYANQFTKYWTRLQSRQLDAARRDVRHQLGELREDGDTSSLSYQNLSRYEQELETMKVLLQPATLVKKAVGAYQVEPRPYRNGVFGLVLGLFLGVGFALLREALDTRVRSADELHERLGMPLLARLPEPPRKLRREDRLVMVDEPSGVHAEAFRILRTSLDFVRLENEAKTVMVSSAVEAEGKSTTAANLAVALARVGQRVVLVDLDLRRPFLHKFFDLNGPGITQVALGYATLDEALARIPIAAEDVRFAGTRNGNGRTPLQGFLDVLPAGPVPPNVDDFLGSQRLAEIVDELRDRSDIILIDSTPLLFVGDAMALTRAVDGILLVTRLSVVRRPMVRELRRLLDSSPAQKLGFVVTGSDSGESYYHQSYAYYARSSVQAREHVR